MAETPTGSPPPPSLMQRISLAFGAFFGALGDAGYAARLAALRDAGVEMHAERRATAMPPAPAVAPLHAASPEAAMQLLGLLQREARLIDFLEDDIDRHSDADIGVAARVVHDGCRKVLREHFSIEPVRSEAEGSRIVLDAGFDAGAVRLTGHVVGQPPFRGSLSHRGWRVADVRLPKLAERHDVAVLAPAEVEL